MTATEVPEFDDPASETEPTTARRWTVYVLVVLSSLAIVLSVLVVWAHRTVLSTGGWVGTVGPVFEDPEVVVAVSEHGAEQIVVALDVERRAEEVLPGPMRFLAAPVTVAAEEFATGALERVLSEPGFEELWVEGNTVLHETALRVLRDEADRTVVYPDGTVTLNLFPAIDRALKVIDERTEELVSVNAALPELSDPTDPELSRAELSQALGVELAPDFGEVEIAQSEQLVELQAYVAAFDLANWLLPLLTIALVAITMWLSWERSRTTLELGIGTTLGAMIVFLLAAYIGSRMADATPAGAGGVLGIAILDQALSSLGLWSALLAASGLLVAVGAYAIGRD